MLAARTPGREHEGPDGLGAGAARLDEAGSHADRIGVFVSFDRAHDGDLVDLLAEQASQQASPFEIQSRSEAATMGPLWEEDRREAIRRSDEVIVLCGEHTTDSFSMATELRIAKEEDRPYVLLWGRRDRMCTTPTSADPSDRMYSWTWEILVDQVLTLRRLARVDGRWRPGPAGVEAG